MPPAMSELIDELRLFCRVVEAGSLRAAAMEFGIDPSNVTRRLVALEQRLGTKLVHRSRVRSTPTDIGQAYYEQLTRILAELDQLETEVGGAAIEPRGLLRVAAPSVFGARHVTGWLYELQASAPKLAIDLVLSDQPIDLVEQRIDLAIRIGALKDSSLTVSRLGTMHAALVAAPRYLARAGTPRTPQELEAHQHVLHANALQSEDLELVGPRNKQARVHCRSRFRVSSMLGVEHAVLAGAGFNAGPLWLYADAIESGELVHLLPDWKLPTTTVQAVTVAGRQRPAKIRSALELLQARVPRLAGITKT